MIQHEDRELVPLSYNKSKATGVQHTSVSSLKTYLDCEMKWYAAKVLGFQSKSGEGARTGKRKHGRLEKYYKRTFDGRIDLQWLAKDRIIRTGLGMLHVRSLLIESEVSFGDKFKLTAGPLPMKGFIDILDHSGPVPEILDFKFLGDPARYGAKAADLVNVRSEGGLQMVGYAAAYSNAYPGADRVRVSHIQFKTKQPKTKDTPALYVTNTLDPRQALEDWHVYVDPIAGRMVKTAALTKDEVPGNLSACEKFGGCSFRADCPTYNKPRSILGAWNMAKKSTTDGPGEPGTDQAAASAEPTTLYFGCYPVGRKTSELTEYAAKVEAVAIQATTENVDDIRMTKAGAFGKWKAFIENAVKAVAIEPADYVVPLGLEKIEVVAAALAALPGVRAVRGGGR